MRLLRRFILVFLVFAVMFACYCEFTHYGLLYIAFLFLLCMAAVALLTGLAKLLFDNSKFLNFFLDIFIFVVLLWFLLMSWPLQKGKRPLDLVLSGQYPTLQDMDRSLAKFGLAGTREIKEELNKTVGGISKNLTETKDAIKKGADL